MYCLGFATIELEGGLFGRNPEKDPLARCAVGLAALAVVPGAARGPLAPPGRRRAVREASPDPERETVAAAAIKGLSSIVGDFERSDLGLAALSGLVGDTARSGVGGDTTRAIGVFTSSFSGGGVVNFGRGGRSLSALGGGTAGVWTGSGGTGGAAALAGAGAGAGLGERICCSRACKSCFGSNGMLRRLIL